MYLQSLVIITTVLVNMGATLPDPQDLHNYQGQHGQHSEGREKHGQHSQGQENHGHHSEVENFQPQSKPIPTKQEDHNSGAHQHHHVHIPSSLGTPQFQFSQFHPPQPQFPQVFSPFGFQQPSPQLLNCQCYPASQQFSPFQSGFHQPQQFNALPTGYQQPFQQRQSSSKVRPHCHITCHEH